MGAPVNVCGGLMGTAPRRCVSLALCLSSLGLAKWCPGPFPSLKTPGLGQGQWLARAGPAQETTY